MNRRSHSRRLAHALGGLFISAVLAAGLVLPGSTSISAAAALGAEGVAAPAVNDYQFSAGFSSIQGGSRWYYQQWNGSAYSTPMAWNTATATWQGSAPYLLVRPATQHPDAGKDSVRAWVAPRSGTVRIRSALGDITVATGAGADGVKVQVLKNSGNVWPATGYGSINPGTGASFNAIDVTVSQGDTLYFHVNQNGGTAYDTVTWVPVITYREGCQLLAR